MYDLGFLFLVDRRGAWCGGARLLKLGGQGGARDISRGTKMRMWFPAAVAHLLQSSMSTSGVFVFMLSLRLIILFWSLFILVLLLLVFSLIFLL